MNICKHCNQPTFKLNEFCCNGCRIANNLISSLNLQKYYEYCKKIYGIEPMKINEISNQLTYDEHIYTSKDGTKTINLLVEGIRCGSCVWLIESSLRKNTKITSATINMSTKRLVIKWNDDNLSINEIIKQIFALGYKLIPFTPDNYERQAKMLEDSYLKRISVAGLVSVAMMMIIWGVWAGNMDNSMGDYTRQVTHILAALIALPAILYSGWPFLQSAFSALKARRTNIDIPISIGIIGAVFISLQQMILASHYVYFDAAISLIFFLLIGRYLDFKARNKARSFAQSLILSQPKVITLIINNQLMLMPLSQAKLGDVAFISAGEKIAADGVIIEGSTEIDNSLITGETALSKFKVGDKVNCGTINMGEPIKLKIIALAGDTLLGEIIKLMEIAEQGRSKYIKIADRLSSYFTPVTLALSFLTLLLWRFIFNAGLDVALLHSIALLIITCPCALGLAVPVVNIIASSNLMIKGIFIKSSDALEKLSNVDYVVFDKTGTLTEAQPKLSNRDDIPDNDYCIISALASHSKHPLCKSISGEMMEFNGQVKEVRGMGMIAEHSGITLKLGSRKLCNVDESIVDSSLEMWFKKGDDLPIRLTFHDTLRGDAYEVINYFKEKNFNVVILSGDRLNVVKDAADKLEVTQYFGEYSPIQKYEYLESLSKAGKKVMMVGDGLNDAAALKAAYVSISPSTSLEITQVSSDIVFQGQKLDAIVQAYKCALMANKLIKQNLSISLVYNLISIPFAMAGLVNPIVAAIAMSCSSITVILNSLRLRFNIELDKSQTLSKSRFT